MNADRRGFGEKFKRQQGKSGAFGRSLFETAFFKHKVPPAYSRADENARSLTAVGMTTILEEVKRGIDRLKLVGMMTIFESKRRAR
jgi:hypothetical protein